MSNRTPPGDAIERIVPDKRSTVTECATCGANIGLNEYCYRIGKSGGGTQVSPEDTLVCVSCGQAAMNQT